MFKTLLIANRGEVALRIARAAADLGLPWVQARAADDLPVEASGGTSLALPGAGPAAYLNAAALITLARDSGCDAVHPGWGFLSESAGFAQGCADAGLAFVGPAPEALRVLGDKACARALAADCGVPLLAGSLQAVTLAQAQDFLAAQGGAGIMVKALAGGGGRGMRAVRDAAELPAAYARCAAEARAAFGAEALYVERLMPGARHIEVQVAGDGRQVLALGERECTLQRNFQKMIEIAPSPKLSHALRERLTHAALAMARALAYRTLGTFEFLVDEASAARPFVFIEANPRLQVEHTVTEQVTGLDLVQLQIALAAGRSLADLGLDAAHPPATRGVAIQWRLCAEVPDAQGRPQAAGGTPTRLDWPAGPGLRVDTDARVGRAVLPQYDSLLAKLVVYGTGWGEALRRSRRALAECRLEGLASNLGLLRALAARPEFESQAVDTGFVEAHGAELLAPAAAGEAVGPARRVVEPCVEPDADANADADGRPHGALLCAPTAGRLAQRLAAPGDRVAAGAALAVLEAMKMEHLVLAPQAGHFVAWLAEEGQVLARGQGIARLQPLGAETVAPEDRGAASGGAPALRADLQRLQERLALTLDAARPAAVAARHARGLRTARENIADLCDPGSFSEYGALAVAAQSRRRSAQDLIENTPADGLVAGIGSVNGASFDAHKARTVVLAYDATVLAGTQGLRNHQKTDRLLGLALRNRHPVVLFAEGGGGRPGDTDMPVVAGLHVGTFSSFARLSGQVPLLGIAAGRCFAGNAALLGCCDLVIATRGANIGMGGPAMIEGGGLGRVRPEQIGPAPLLAEVGVVDLLVEDEAAAVAAARRALACFQGTLARFEAPDGAALRTVLPENRRRVYDMRGALAGLFDLGSVLELRGAYGLGVITALARLEGRPVGVLASNPAHLGGAIDPDAADKAACFMQLCNARGLPLVSLVDTPGFMVGPEVEARAQVRHAARLFVAAAGLRVPCFTVVLRKGYGLGAMAMATGGFHAGDFTIAWPTGEFGAMGLEGAVRLGWRKELDAMPEGSERESLVRQLLAQQAEAGSALNMAATLEIDAVVDPVQTRAWLARGLAGATMRQGAARSDESW